MHGAFMAHQPQNAVRIAMDKVGYRGEAFLREGIVIAPRIEQFRRIWYRLTPDGVSGSLDETPVMLTQAKRKSLRDRDQLIQAQATFISK
jgi:hypothetical protein